MTARVEAPWQPVSVPLWWPTREADAEGFDAWTAQPNFRRTSDRRRVFVAAVREALMDRRCARDGAPVTALDIGCGQGISEHPVEGPAFLRGIREAADVLVGLEPDPAVSPAHGLFDQVVRSTMEEALLAPASVDVAYAYYVVEHVAQPARFLAAVARVLRPGGVFVAMTPHGGHWFSRMARLAGRLRMDGALLRVARGAREADAYHYPVTHALNDPERLLPMARDIGFTTVRPAMFDHGDVLPYLPRVVRPLYDWWSRQVEGRGRQPLVCLLLRMETSDDLSVPPGMPMERTS